MSLEKINHLMGAVQKLKGLENFLVQNTPDPSERKKILENFSSTREEILRCIDIAMSKISEIREQYASTVLDAVENKNSEPMDFSNTGEVLLSMIAELFSVQGQNMWRTCVVLAEKLDAIEGLSKTERQLRRWGKGEAMPTAPYMEKLLSYLHSKNLDSEQIANLQKAYDSLKKVRQSATFQNE